MHKQIYEYPPESFGDLIRQNLKKNLPSNERLEYIRILGYNLLEGIDAPATVMDAMTFAIKAHEGQKYGENDYTFHLFLVYQIIQKYFPYDYLLQSCAWLHDVLEDTNIKYCTIERKFGNKIAEIVYAVTNETGRNRKESFKKTSIKIRGNVYATCIKLADRIANINASIQYKTHHRRMYLREHNTFVSLLHGPIVADFILWPPLEDAISRLEISLKEDKSNDD